MGNIKGTQIAVLLTILTSNTVFAAWNREVIVETPTWVFTPGSDITGNTKIRNNKRALMVVLHGCAQNATQLKEFGNWTDTANEYGLVVAIPDATPPFLSAKCFNYNEGLDASGHGRDILNLVETLKRRTALNIDTNQVYVTGLSGGAALALQLACDEPTVFSGIGAVAGPSVGSKQPDESTKNTPTTNLARAVSKCKTLGDTQLGAFRTSMIASIAYGDLDKDGGGRFPIPPPQQGVISLVDVDWSKDNAQVFINLFGSSGLSQGRPVQGGKGEESVSSLNGKDVVSLIKMVGVGHAWPAGQGNDSISQGGLWIHKVGFNYPAYVTKWFFANNRRIPPEGANQSPQISAVSFAVAGNNIVVTGNATDSDGSIERINIDLVDNQAASTTSNAAGDFTHTFGCVANGQYIVRVTAVDNRRAISLPFDRTVSLKN